MGTQESKRVRAIEHSIAILDTLRTEEGATLARLDALLPVSKTTIYHHLETLGEAGYVERNGDEYCIGLSLVTLGGYRRDSMPIFQHGRRFVDMAAADTGEFVALTTRHHLDSIHLYRAEGERAFQTDSYMGVRYRLHTCASGRAYMAFLSAEEVETYLADISSKEQGAPGIDHDTLQEKLAAIRESRVAKVDGERIKGLRSVAVPVCDRSTGRPLGTLAIAGPKGSIDDDRFHTEIPAVLKDYAETLEMKLEFA